MGQLDHLPILGASDRPPASTHGPGLPGHSSADHFLLGHPSSSTHRTSASTGKRPTFGFCRGNCVWPGSARGAVFGSQGRNQGISEVFRAKEGGKPGEPSGPENGGRRSASLGQALRAKRGPNSRFPRTHFPRHNSTSAVQQGSGLPEEDCSTWNNLTLSYPLESQQVAKHYWTLVPEMDYFPAHLEVIQEPANPSLTKGL